jgi:hypothetical protein
MLIATPRRALVAALLLALLMGSLPLSASGQAPPPQSPTADNPILRENALPGGSQWERVSAVGPHTGLDHPEGNVAEGSAGPDAVDHWEVPPIHGYADRISVEAGDTVRFYVSTAAPRFDLHVNRMGWYGGLGGREVHAAFGLVGTEQPIPEPDPATGLIAANWLPSHALTISYDWVSGVYLVRLLAANEARDIGYILFVVRNDGQPADFVYKLPVNTYQAYNNWGGKSLYDYNSVGGRATKVSFDRPYSQWDGAGQFFDWDYPTIRWLEREGYNVTYITDVDAHTGNTYITGRRVLLSAGHDQYWSREMRESWEAARDIGRSLAFLGGNTAYWQVRYEPSARGVANRVLVCYKQATLDPLNGTDNARVTVAFRTEIVNRPENALLGVQWEATTGFGNTFPYVVQAADHWIFDRTGAQPGEAWSAVVGAEVDRAVDSPTTPRGLVVLSASPVVDLQGRTVVANSTYYRQGGMVFAAGTVDWAWGLDDWRAPGLVDARLQRVTANVLDAFRQGRPPREAPAARPAAADAFPWLLLAAGLLLPLLGVAGAFWYLRRRTSKRYDPWAE